MAYTKTEWLDHLMEYPERFDVVDNPDGTKKITRKPGTILQQGVSVNSNNLNKMEQGIYDAHVELDKFGNVIEVNRRQDRLLANHEAWFDVDSRATPNSGKYYDLFDNTNNLSIAQIDQTKTRATTSLTASTTAVTITVESVTGLKVGQEVTIFDDVNLERKVISSIDATNKTVTVPSLTNSYKQYANVCRSSVIVDTTNKLLKFDGWGTHATLDRSTPTTVVASAFSTAGNGGRKLVRDSKGALYALMTASTDYMYLYKSTDHGSTWSLVNSLSYTGYVYYACLTIDKNDMLHTFFTMDFPGGTSSIEDALYYAKGDWSGGWTTLYDAGGSAYHQFHPSAIINDSEIHVSWHGKNASYPNSFNILYIKGTIASDGSVTWGTVQQVTKENTSGVDITNPSITVIGDNTPRIILQLKSGTTAHNIQSWYLDGSTWRFTMILEGGSYAQANPSAIFVPSSVDGTTNGTIHVAWEGDDSDANTGNDIRHSKSVDGGATWSAMSKLTAETENQKFPSISVDKDNKIVIIWQGGDPNDGNSYYQIRKIENVSGTWGTIATLTSNTTANAISPSTISDITMDFDEPPFIYEDDQAVDIKFRGKWVVGTTVAVKTVDVRYNISPTSSITEGVAWVERQISETALTGTVEVTSTALSTVTGTSTLFTTELAVGNVIQIGNEMREVSAIASDTSLTVTKAFDSAKASGSGATKQNYWIDGAISVVGDTANESYVTMSKTTVNLSSTKEEDQLIGSVGTANKKGTLRLTLNRSATTNATATTKLLGAVN